MKNAQGRKRRTRVNRLALGLTLILAVAYVVACGGPTVGPGGSPSPTPQGPPLTLEQPTPEPSKPVPPTATPTAEPVPPTKPVPPMATPTAERASEPLAPVPAAPTPTMPPPTQAPPAAPKQPTAAPTALPAQDTPTLKPPTPTPAPAPPPEEPRPKPTAVAQEPPPPPQPPPARGGPTRVVRPSTSPYGVNDWNWTDESMAAMKEAGINWMRIMVNWSKIEANRGTQVWNMGANDKIDSYVAQAQKYGMEVTASLYNAPGWAKQPGLGLPDPTLFAGFVKAFLARYAGKIAAVEVLNEENTALWPETRNRDSRFYAPILKEAYQAVKQASPNTLVATSGLWSSPVGYLEDLYALGAKDSFDVVNFHYYPGNRSPATGYNRLAAHLRKVMEKYGDGDKPIWLTEFGWTVSGEHRGDNAATTVVSPQEQVDFMRYVLDSSMKSGFIEKIFWYVLRDDDGMAMVHTTDNYDWRTPQPRLGKALQPQDTTLVVEGDWTRRWPGEGVLVVGGEQVAYNGLVTQAGGTAVQGLTRGANGTAPGSHAPGVQVKNRDLTANARRPIYYTYKDFIQAHPTWDASEVAAIPDLPQPASRPATIANAGFEGGKANWAGGFEIDTAEKHSGAASLRVQNDTGKLERVTQKGVAVEPGRSFLLRAWLKVAPGGSGNMNAMVMADQVDSSGKFLAAAPGNYYVYDTGGEWREVRYPIWTPAQTSQLVIHLSTEKGTGVAWFDDISVEPYDLSGR